MSGFGYNVLGFGANASSAASLPSDDQFNRVSFLSHFDGANNGVNNAFDDSSSSNHTITANGNATQGSFGPFARPDGEWGVSFDGGDDDYLSLSPQADFAFGTGDFSVSLWVLFNNVGTYDYLIDGRNSGQTSGTWTLSINYTNGASGKLMFASGSSAVLTSDTDLVASQWYYISVSRSGTTSRMHFNGTQVAINSSDSTNYSTSPNTSYIGTRYSTEHSFDGILSNVRVVKGTALSDYTPPTSPLTAITNTKLLTCQSNRFVDNSASGHAITPTGTPAVTAFGPFLSSSVYDAAVNGASGYFDYSASTNLTAADSADWDFGSDDFTVEFWMYVTRSGVIQGIFSHWGDFNGSNIAWSFEINSSNRLAFLFKTSGITVVTISSSTSDYLNQWVHVAAVRNSNTFAVYLNGVSKATTTTSSAINNCTDVLRVGAYQADYGFDGYICDARIVKGTAVYTGNFTPPTAPLTAITNTKLLLNMADAQAIDSAAQSNMSLHGDANTSTDQAKFGTASLHLDGTGDFSAGSDTSVGHFGAGNFTAECWVYPTASPQQPIIMGQWNGSYSWAIQMSNDSSRNLRFLTSSVGDQVSSTAVALNQWSHVALVRNGNTFDIYLNGTSVKTATNSAALLASTDAFTIGNNAGGGQPYQGYIDEVRISKFARYTSNFTAPSEPFADKGQ